MLNNNKVTVNCADEKEHCVFVVVFTVITGGKCNITAGCHLARNKKKSALTCFGGDIALYKTPHLFIYLFNLVQAKVI
jgi:hypothetical protein